jgi:hypothetical protein
MPPPNPLLYSHQTQTGQEKDTLALFANLDMGEESVKQELLAWNASLNACQEAYQKIDKIKNSLNQPGTMSTMSSASVSKSSLYLIVDKMHLYSWHYAIIR